MNHLARRLALLEAARYDATLQTLLLARCRRDIFFWFDCFCWTFDPRKCRPHREFVLYPFQHRAVREIMQAIRTGNDLLIEKSRDMGLSWLVLLVFQYLWLFEPGANFHLGSRKRDFVDCRGDISTLFEKLRYNLDWLPCWMLPDGYERYWHDNLFKLVNPANGNVISGESGNANFARGGRYRSVLFDEFPFWDNAEAAYASAGQSTPSRIVVGTPYGKNNRFAELRFEKRTKVLSFHWNEHPEKDKAWYARQRERMSGDEIARELDINYNLSVKNRVFANFGPQHVTRITPPVASESHAPRIVRSWDFGYHCPACLFIHIDDDGVLCVLAECVGERELLTDFARRVQTMSATLFPGCAFEDICDPAGAQKSDKSLQTSIEILNSLGIYPYYDRSRILDGIELIRMKLAERVPKETDQTKNTHSRQCPGLLVDHRCETLIAAFEGGYRYPPTAGELPMQEHPHEDVMDCLRYAVMAKCSPTAGKIRRPPRKRRPSNRYTGY